MTKKQKPGPKAVAKKLLRDKKFRNYCIQTGAVWGKAKLSASDIVYLYRKFTGEEED